MRILHRLSCVFVCMVLLAGPAGGQPRAGLDAGNLDGREAVPDWLRFYVQKALPGDGMTVWVPGGAFDVSSLVRVPRFPGAKIAAWPADSALVLRGVRNEQVSAQLAVIGTEVYIQGDEYLVYPGAGGPMSSIRWELLKDGIEDVELVRALQAAGQLDGAAVQRAVALATQTPDGREKDLRDLVRARMLLQR